jgi:hypothetical protein
VQISDSRQLANPFAGGLNTPQFSSINLNGDSLADLFVFDRSGHKILPFVADPSIEGGYQYAPEYEAFFPTLQEWALLRDFNQDSIQDIFTFSDTGVPGIDVYRGFRDNSGPYFQKVVLDNPVRVLGYPTSSGTVTNIYVAAGDIPAIDDIDQDGDLDILTFQSEGTKLYYYRNISIENGLGPDSLIFVLEDRCWGKFVESFNTNDVVLSPDSLTCPGSTQNARLHGGSTVMTLDADKDDDKDLLLGDFSYETILYLENGGSRTHSWITKQTQDYPNASDRISVPYFPVTFLLDINHDGIDDLLAAPNQKDARENVLNSWYYHGSEDPGTIEFSLVGKSFLNDEMLDFGTDASPLLLDYNGDGLMDLVVGSRFNVGYNVEHPSQLFLFTNIGSLTNPSFTLTSEDWLNLGNLVDEVDALAPVSGDLDDDGDLDLIIGNKRGKLIYIENIGVEGGPFEMGEISYPWFDIDVGFSSSPALVDPDGDGVYDLFVGEEKGNINYFKNFGTKESPLFLADIEFPENQEEYGGIDARQNNAVFGMAAPTVFQSQDTTFLIVGTAFGNMLLYDISNAQPQDILNPIVDHPIARIKDGARSKPFLEDLNADGYLDLVMGSTRGGLTLFNTEFRRGQVVSTYSSQLTRLVSLSPNPASDHLRITVEGYNAQEVKFFSAQGQLVKTWRGRSSTIGVDIGDFTPGLYFAVISTGDLTAVKSWIKM